MTRADPYHDGERDVQERAGESEAALRNGVILRGTIPPRAIPFLAEQRMLALGSVDELGAIWASVLFGARGFASGSDGRTVVIDRARMEVSPDELVGSRLCAGSDVGLLAIEFGSRRRLRINGFVTELHDRRIEVSVREAYPNCPKYVQRRHLSEAHDARRVEPEAPASGVVLDEVRSLCVERADTFFVASRHPTRGLDVSHRGGAPGFVRLLNTSCLRIPDYPGNSMFNTLGNFVIDNHAGLVFLDFERRRLLQMTGTVSLRFDEQEDPRQPTGGTGRYWDFQVARWLEFPVVTRLAWELLDFSPHNPHALE